MNKKDLAKKIAEVTELNQIQVENVLNVFQQEIKDAVADGDKVMLSGFIMFEKKHLASRSGVSQLTHEPWTSPEKDIINVKLAKAYKEL